jgi:hypothetical protein
VGSSLIYVAIVAMWAGLLIPMWLRRHESETEVRSVDRFSSAMRILSRRTPPPPDRRYLVMPQRPAGSTLPVADVPRAAVRRSSQPTSRVAPARVRSARTRSTVVARRRQVLIALAVITFFTFALALAGFLSWWWQLVADLAVLAFVAHLRSEAKRATAIARRRQQLKARRTAVPDGRPAAPVHEAVDVPMPAIVASSVAVGSGPLVIDEETWEPVPVPLPTYVTAPVAERPEPMTIDLTRPGQWTEEMEREPLFDQEEFDDDFANYGDDEQELAEIVTRRRAVND